MNDITNTQIFEVVFRALEEHGLIQVSANTEDEKKKARNDCLPIIQRIQENDRNLEENLIELMKILRIDFDSKASLETIFKNIIMEIKDLQMKNISLENRLSAMENDLKLNENIRRAMENDLKLTENRLSAMENDLKLKETYCLGYDLLWLFIFYYVEPAIDRVYPGKTWNYFTSEWSNREELVLTEEFKNKTILDDPMDNEDIQNHQIVQTWISPVQSSLEKSIGRSISLNILRKIAINRHQVIHHDRKSVRDQRTFLQKCKDFQFPENYEHTEYLQYFIDIISALDQDSNNTNLRRMNLKTK